ncbi:MAG: exodeoxyribonuclease V subunit gamma [Gammaproteobacteria bacterium]|nr:exodeoxyribonuclease V subunit gamma [Gammaproteobacteria bacterium]
MLRVHHSNRTEQLVAALAETLRNPLESWLTPEIVIVESRGMERYLTLGLANTLGISAHIEFPYPARFLWEAYRAVFPDLPETSPFDKGVLAWRTLRLLDELEPEDEATAPLLGYLTDADAFERFELAWKIADVFDQYLVYRPDWLNRWDAGQDGHWQAVLWRKLAMHRIPHRARLQQDFLGKLKTLKKRPPGLPERVSVLGINSLPTAYLETLQALSKLCQIDLYLLNPCRQYWGLIQTEREIARHCGEEEAASLYLETGNRLLASLGRQGRDFHHLLSEIDAAPTETFVDLPEDNLLHCLQADILDLRNRGANAAQCAFDALTQDISATPISITDRSLQVHVCHSATREVEVLHDQLLALFEADPSLKASDVVVMTPDIEVYAPAVRAVFDTAKPYIHYSLADRDPRAENAIMDAFLGLLELPDGRFDVNQVLALLEVPAVLSRFDLGETDLPLIKRWLRETTIRWGVDAKSRAALDLPDTSEHTWQAGLERLLLGFALPTGETRLYEHILPYDAMEGESARIMGRLQRFTRQLFALSDRLAGEHTLDVWQTLLLAVLDDFIAASDAFENEREALRAVLGNLADTGSAAAFTVPVSSDVIRAWLRHNLNTGGNLRGFLWGGVTFCTMVPMRSIPFRIVCLIGLNDGAYPRSQHPADFDLMAQKPRRGDRSRRLDDRYLFLEALLSARDVLYLSHVGRSIRDNSAIPPSVLVSEILDYVRQGVFPESAPTANPLSLIVTEHPLQAFSPRYFVPDEERLFSYSPLLRTAASQAGRGEIERNPLLRGPLPEPDGAFRQLDFQNLIWFFLHPTRYLLRERLKIQLKEQDGLLESREPFALEPFADESIRQRLLDQQLAGQTPADIQRLVRAAGLLPHGAIGRFLYRRELGRLKPLLETLRENPVTPGVKPEVNLSLGEFQLTGWLANVTARGLQNYAVRAPSARHYLELWIRHLVLNCLRPRDVDLYSTWHGLGETLVLRPMENPFGELRKLLTLYWQGLSEPLHFFPRSALAYAETARKSPNGDPLSAAQGCWDGNEHRRGEGRHPYYQLAFRYQDPIDETFVELARQVFDPLFEHLQS